MNNILEKDIIWLRSLLAWLFVPKCPYACVLLRPSRPWSEHSCPDDPSDQKTRHDKIEFKMILLYFVIHIGVMRLTRHSHQKTLSFVNMHPRFIGFKSIHLRQGWRDSNIISPGVLRARMQNLILIWHWSFSNSGERRASPDLLLSYIIEDFRDRFVWTLIRFWFPGWSSLRRHRELNFLEFFVWFASHVFFFKHT